MAAHVRAIYEEHGVGWSDDFEDDLLDPMRHYEHGAFWVVDAPRGLGTPTPILATAGVVSCGGTRLIKRIYVAAAGRRTGLARRLVRLVAGWGGFPRTELWSDVRFRNAHRLYLSEGFQAGAVRVLDDPDRSVERYFSRPW